MYKREQNRRRITKKQLEEAKRNSSCRRCKQLGHWARECPLNRNRGNTRHTAPPNQPDNTHKGAKTEESQQTSSKLHYPAEYHHCTCKGHQEVYDVSFVCRKCDARHSFRCWEAPDYINEFDITSDYIKFIDLWCKTCDDSREKKVIKI